MRYFLPFVIALSMSSYAFAQTGTSFLTSDGVNRAPASVMHCVNAANVAIPCGTAFNPVVVTGSNLASASNQMSELQLEQAIASAAGTPGDSQFISGSGSLISLLKSVFSALASGVYALPVNSSPISRSVSLVSSTSTSVFPANSGRHYLAMQAPASTAIWVNFLGGTASPNGMDCVQLQAGTLYESGQYVTRGSVSVYSPIAVTLAAWEG